MNTAHISKSGLRIGVILTSLVLAAVLIFPIWKIYLIAPQYPEGLTLKIWAGKLSGDIDVVNGLNHYIGMKVLKQEEFTEFKVLPILLIFFSAFGLLTGILNRRKLLYIWMTGFLIFAIASMVDFYHWEYNYGHNLDPKAPIKVPGMSYQPPLIGTKQLLNFTAYSIPDIGGWIFIGTGVLMFLFTFLEWKTVRKLSKKIPTVALISLFALFIVSCGNEGPVAINYGKDDCANCKMTIVDKRFAVEIITQKRKVFKLDDLGCAAQFIKNNGLKSNEIKTVYVTDYKGEGNFIKLKESFVIKSENLGSPMRGDMAVFSTEKEAGNFVKEKGGVFIPRDSVLN